MPVSNSSPLIHMARLGKLRFARAAFASLHIPPAVRSETVEAGFREGYSDVVQLQELEKAGWLVTTRLSPGSRKFADELAVALGAGEAEAIALARQRRERLFIDDQKGRRAAEFYGVETSTTLSLMIEMLAQKSLGLADYEKNVKEYGSRGWVSSDVIQLYLEKGKEIG